MKKEINDSLSWNAFYQGALKRKVYPPKATNLFNRLVAHTKNLFAISGVGAFIPGYLLVMTKELTPSFGMIKKEDINEMNWFIKILSSSLVKKYKKNVVKFEHGMCACVGGLDRAHLHIIPISKKISSKDIKNAINKTLIKRKVGIESITFKGTKLQNQYDINKIMEIANKKNYKIEGKQLLYEDLINTDDFKKYPLSVKSEILKGKHYVYFDSNFKNSSFLSYENFSTQMGREIIYYAELKYNKELLRFNNKIIKENNFANIWKWQEYSFKKNMRKTMSDLIPELVKVCLLPEAKKYNYKTFKLIKN